MEKKRQVSRREFMRLSAFTTAGAVLVGAVAARRPRRPQLRRNGGSHYSACRADHAGYCTDQVQRSPNARRFGKTEQITGGRPAFASQPHGHAGDRVHGQVRRHHAPRVQRCLGSLGPHQMPRPWYGLVRQRPEHAATHCRILGNQ